jgi:chromate transport protein ChrA
MSETFTVIIKYAAILLVVIITAISLLYVLDFINDQDAMEALTKSMKAWGIVTVASLVIALIAASGKSNAV